MFKIPKVENSKYYIDRIMNDMQNFANNQRNEIQQRFEKSIGTKKKDPKQVSIDKRKDLELEKIRFLNQQTALHIKKLSKTFPDFRKIDDIYIKLINTSQTPVKKIQDALARLLWISNTIDELAQNSEFKIKKARTSETIGFILKKYMGRVNSYYRKNKEFYQILDDARKYMNQLPNFKNLYTISIAGFPNVGKSTLMKKITNSDVEIQNYPFTTKGLMFGYINKNNEKIIQLIDTPGLLGREKNNAIEERAQIIITQYCSEIIFVIDFTQSCGFEIESQIKLLKKTQNQTDKPIIIYLSKTDIFNEEDEELKKEYENKLKKHKVFVDSEKLKEYITNNYLKSTSKFDPKKVNLIK
ncbi:MAG: 50S ribosome-binding GTPase [Nanoarchaeota archaeon]|nr:50S ribosome-binding GTPase [Nanoarchaeota archaeon]